MSSIFWRTRTSGAYPFPACAARCRARLGPYPRGLKTEREQRENHCGRHQESLRVHDERTWDKAREKKGRYPIAGLLILKLSPMPRDRVISLVSRNHISLPLLVLEGCLWPSFMPSQPDGAWQFQVISPWGSICARRDLADSRRMSVRIDGSLP